MQSTLSDVLIIMVVLVLNDSDRIISNEVIINPPGEYINDETICICTYVA